MATKWYLHNATSTVVGTLPSTRINTRSITSTATNAAVNRVMNTTIGVSQVQTETTTSGTVQGAWMRRFISLPLSAQTISGTFECSGATNHDTSLAGNSAGQGWNLYLWRPSTGSVVSTLYSPGSGTTEWTTSFSLINQEVPGNDVGAPSNLTSQTCQDGDVMVAELTGFGPTNLSVYYDGTTEGSSSTNAAFLSFSGTITLFTPGGSTRADAIVTTVERSVWTTPTDGSQMGTLPVLAFTIPTSRDRDMHFEIQIDTVNTYDSGNLQTYRSYPSQTGWEYFNGSSFVAVPSGGVPKANAGNAARYTVQSALSPGTTYYRRVRALAV